MQLQVSPGLAHPQPPTLSLGSADTNSEPVTRRETGLPDGGEQSVGLDTPGGRRAPGSLRGKTGLLSRLTLGKLQQLRLPGRGCSSDDRALWRVCGCEPVCALARALPNSRGCGEGQGRVGRKRKPASPAGGACYPVRSTPPAAGLQPPLAAAPPSCRCALPPRRGRPRHARSPEVPLSALPHPGTRTACCSRRPRSLVWPRH